jgi:hypothetical protein
MGRRLYAASYSIVSARGKAKVEKLAFHGKPFKGRSKKMWREHSAVASSRVREIKKE